MYSGERVSMGSLVSDENQGGAVPLRRERKARAETLFLSCRRSLLLSFLPSSLASRRSSSSISSSSFLRRATLGKLPVGVDVSSSADTTLFCLICWRRREM